MSQVMKHIALAWPDAVQSTASVTELNTGFHNVANKELNSWYANKCLKWWNTLP